jgi:hypothetical protein
MITKLRGAKNLVEQVLFTIPSTRNSDVLLIAEVWKRQGLILTDDQIKVLMQVSNPETIRRNRCLFQAKGMYPASDEVRKERGMRELEVTQSIKGLEPKIPKCICAWDNYDEIAYTNPNCIVHGVEPDQLDQPNQLF